MRLTLAASLAAALAPLTILAACADAPSRTGEVAALPTDEEARPRRLSEAPGPLRQEGFRPDAEACLVQTLYHEARGEGDEGMKAVGAVVLNRRASVAYPDTVCDVVRQGGDLGRCQFSWFCDGRPDTMEEGPALENARRAARALLAGAGDPTDGATSFHAVRVRPAWADEMEETTRIGSHLFYAGESGEGG